MNTENFQDVRKCASSANNINLTGSYDPLFQTNTLLPHSKAWQRGAKLKGTSWASAALVPPPVPLIAGAGFGQLCLPGAGAGSASARSDPGAPTRPTRQPARGALSAPRGRPALPSASGGAEPRDAAPPPGIPVPAILNLRGGRGVTRRRLAALHRIRQCRQARRAPLPAAPPRPGSPARSPPRPGRAAPAPRPALPAHPAVMATL